MVAKVSPWDADEVLELNRQRLLRSARDRMRLFETKYHLRSDELESALEKGDITETSEVGDWLFALHTFRSMSTA